MTEIQQYKEFIDKISEVKPGAIVVTIGAGDPEIFKYLSREKQCRVFGVELVELKERLPEVSIAVSNPFNSNYKALFPDLIGVDAVLNFLKDPIRNFRAFDVLVPLFTSGTRTLSVLELREDQEQLILDFAERIPLYNLKIEKGKGSLFVYGTYKGF